MQQYSAALQGTSYSDFRSISTEKKTKNKQNPPTILKYPYVYMREPNHRQWQDCLQKNNSGREQRDLKQSSRDSQGVPQREQNVWNCHFLDGWC